MSKPTSKLGAELFTDALKSYEGLGEEYLHQIVDHAVEYVKGNVHTNGMENFWSHLKRTIYGTYIFVMPFHLFRYLDEQIVPVQQPGYDRCSPVSPVATNRDWTPFDVQRSDWQDNTYLQTASVGDSR